METVGITVDARGQSCPGPLVTLARAIRSTPAGGLFELLCTDPGSKSDVPSWAKLTGNELLEVDERDGVFRYVVKVA